VTRESPAARQRCQCLALDGPSAQGEDSPLSHEMVTKLERRNVLRAAGALAALSVPFTLALRRSQRAEPSATTPHSRSGRLIPDARGLCDLPEGFSYTIIDRAPGPLSDGYRVPACPDGMGCFSGPNGTLVLMRNHELERSPALGPFRGGAPAEAYDPEAAGCVTRVVLNSTTLERISSNLVLAGTIRNCGGGTSPWGWLSCEESVTDGHGYVFLCRTDASALSAPQKIACYGRFNHEAVCVDPKTSVAYLTEDRTDGCFYRFVPSDPARPFDGRLEALALAGSPRHDTGLRLRPRELRPVMWIPLTNTDASDDSLRFRAQELGAAIVRRGEGAWFHQGAVYFSATSGGSRGAGQIFRLELGAPAGPDRLEVLVESEDSAALDSPDNITVAPWGDVYIAEDGPGEQYVRGLTRDGRVFDVLRNAHSGGELAGLCFAPDGGALFVNFYREAMTIAVRGPFQRLAT